MEQKEPRKEKLSQKTLKRNFAGQLVLQFLLESIPVWVRSISELRDHYRILYTVVSFGR